MILGMGFRTSLPPLSSLKHSQLTLLTHSPQHLHPPRLRQLRLLHDIRPRRSLRATPPRHNRLRSPLRLRQSAPQRRRHDLRPFEKPLTSISGPVVAGKRLGEKSAFGSEDPKSVAVYLDWRSRTPHPRARAVYLEMLL